MSKNYDVAVIGSGPGGYVSAIRLRQLDRTVCVIDLDEARLGGVCLNEGCIPVKSLINSAVTFSTVKRAGEWGVEAELKAPDMKRMVRCSQNTVSRLRAGLKGLFKKYKIDFIEGRAKLITGNKVKIDLKNGKEEEIEADKIIVAAGSSPEVPPGIKVDRERIITSSEVIKLERVPRTLLVIGAGVVGVEYASMFAFLETRVTLIEAMPDILPFEDGDVSRTLAGIFKKRGIEVFTNTKAVSLNRKKETVEVVLASGGGEKKSEFDYVLIAAGRKPNTKNIGLNEAGVKLNNGFMVTDDKMRTNIKNIYAVGDVLNTPMYAHAAYKEGLIAAENIAGEKTEKIDYKNVPGVVFSQPQVASVGLTEKEAKERGRNIAVSKHFFKANSMAAISHKDEGFIKIVADKDTKAILGAHIIGGEAAEILHEFVIAKNSGLSIEDVAKTVHAHPTFSEIAVDAAKAVFGKPIHG
ncbi:MAG: dihydrolipoyl dehydrogenase [Candidatus Omnitrophota bacterium]|nr:dihydrolipoyl dehydrogenase [Candidatus Omnitrophota bacterium]